LGHVHADPPQSKGLQVSAQPPHEIESIVRHPHPLRIMFRHADHIVFGVTADVSSVFFRLPEFPPDALDNPWMPNVVAFVRPQWLVASRNGDEKEFASRLWRDHQGAPYMLVACGKAFRHLNAPSVQLHHDFPYLLFLSDAPKSNEADIYRIGELVPTAMERYGALRANVFTPSVMSWGTTYLGNTRQVIRHPEFQSALALHQRMFPDTYILDERDIERRGETHLFSRQQLFGKSTPEQILEAMVLFTEHVARERTLHLLDDLVRQHPDNDALWFIGRDLHEENLLDYPVLTHLPRPPRPPAEVHKENLQAVETMLETFEAKVGEDAEKSAPSSAEIEAE